MNNWVEMKDGEDAICICLDKLQQMTLKGDVLHCFYENKGSVESEYLNPASARAAYASLLAQLRGREQVSPEITKALMDMLKVPPKVQQPTKIDEETRQQILQILQIPPLVPVRKNPTDEMPGEAAVRQKVEAFVAATEAPSPMPSTPPRLIPVPPSPHIDGCPCEECAAKRNPDLNYTAQEVPITPGHRIGCTCGDCTRNSVDSAVTVKQGQAAAVPSEQQLGKMLVKAEDAAVHRLNKNILRIDAEAQSLHQQLLEHCQIPAGTPFSKEELSSIGESAMASAMGAKTSEEYNEKYLTSIQQQLIQSGRLLDSKPTSPQGCLVPREEELCKIVDEALTFAEGHTQYVDIIARRIRRQLLERQPKREELSEEQILKLTIEAYEFEAQGQKWNEAPERYQESWVARIKNLLRQLREAGRLL